MIIPITTKHRFIKENDDLMVETLKIEIGKDFEVAEGDTITLYPRRFNKIEIHKRKNSIPEGFSPHYALAD